MESRNKNPHTARVGGRGGIGQEYRYKKRTGKISLHIFVDSIPPGPYDPSWLMTYITYAGHCPLSLLSFLYLFSFVSMS